MAEARSPSASSSANESPRTSSRRDSDPVTLLLVAEIAVAVWRTTWERWGELALAGREVDPVEVYRQCREELRRVVG